MSIDFLISHTGSDININAAAAALLAIVRDVVCCSFALGYRVGSGEQLLQVLPDAYKFLDI